VLTIVPKDSEPAAQAEQILGHFGDVKREAKADIKGEILAACAPGKTYYGSWTASGGVGVVMLKFTDADEKTGSVAAYLFPPQYPRLARPVRGKVEWDARDSGFVIRLRVGRQKGKPADATQARVSKYMDIFLTYMTLRYVEGKLQGTGPTPPGTGRLPV